MRLRIDVAGIVVAVVVRGGGRALSPLGSAVAGALPPAVLRALLGAPAERRVRVIVKPWA